MAPTIIVIDQAAAGALTVHQYRVIDRLIKAGKTFDFLPLPGSDHTDGGPYGRIKRRDFFVKHLLGVDPPLRNSNEL